MNADYYRDSSFCYTEKAIVLEDFHYLSPGKFYIPAIIPTVGGGSPFSSSVPKGSTSNIVNYSSKHGIQSCTVSNYVELMVPIYIGEHIKNIVDMIVKGTEFIVTFVGGEVDDPRILGLYV